MNNDFNMKCLQCGQSESFNISCCTVALIDKDGVQDHGDMEYDHESRCRCPVCGYTGSVSHFEGEGT